MKTPYLTVKFKSAILATILVISFVTFYSLEQVEARHSDEGLTKSLVAGTNIITFRDSTNTNPQTHSVDVDTSSIKAGKIGVTVEEEDSNLDPTIMDVVLSSLTSTTSRLEKTEAVLTETGSDTGVFKGDVFVTLSSATGKLPLSRGDEVTVLYEPEHDGVGRFSAELVGVSGPGTVEINDYSIDDPDGLGTRILEACPYDLVTHPVDLQLSPGTTTDRIIVTLSFANAVLGPHDPNDLKLLYRISTNGLISGFIELDDIPPQNDQTIDTVSKTITASAETFQHILPGGTEINTASGQYALGVKIDNCVGGGGGGLVRPGLVVNALAGSGAISALFSGGSGDGPTEPTFGDATFTLMGNSSGEEGFGGIIAEPATLDSTQTVEVGEEVVLRFDLYENQGINNIETINLYFNFAGENYDKSFIDTYITYNRGEVTLVDPNNKFEYADIEILQKDGWNLVVKATLNFANTMDTSNILIESIDLDRNYGKQFFADAIQVVQPSITLADSKIESVIQTQDNSNIAIRDQQLNHIPIWVKSNALWWKQQQIDDSDFVAGIKYLINQAIIDIPQKDSSSVSIHEVPQWLRDVAGFWADDSISDDEFVQAMQWLIENKVINIQQ